MCMRVCACVYICIYMHTHTHAHTPTYVCVCVCVCVKKYKNYEIQKRLIYYDSKSKLKFFGNDKTSADGEKCCLNKETCYIVLQATFFILMKVY